MGANEMRTKELSRSLCLAASSIIAMIGWWTAAAQTGSSGSTPMMYLSCSYSTQQTRGDESTTHYFMAPVVTVPRADQGRVRDAWAKYVTNLHLVNPGAGGCTQAASEAEAERGQREGEQRALSMHRAWTQVDWHYDANQTAQPAPTAPSSAALPPQCQHVASQTQLDNCKRQYGGS